MFKWLLSPNFAVDAEGLDIDQMDSALTREVAAILARAGVPTFHKTLPRLRDELDRARRYQRPLTVALVGDARAIGGAVMDAAARRQWEASPLGPGSPLIPVLIAPLLSEVTRSVDIVTYASTLARCVIVMPEAGSSQAADAMRRMASLCTERAHVPVQACCATFPGDGLTLEELIRKAASTFDRAALPVRSAAMPIGETLLPDARR
jgi:hypothetical protein